MAGTTQALTPPGVPSASESAAQVPGAGRPAARASSRSGPLPAIPLDLFGGVRRRVEAQAALADNARYQLAAAYLTVTGNAVSQAIAIASLRQQLQAVDDILVGDQKNLDLVQLKFEAGKAAQSDVLTAQSQLEADRTLAPPLDQQLAVARHALAILVGQFPSESSPPAFDLEQLTLAEKLPVSVPSDLVHQRPDILAAEAELHAASATIGIAAAQRYPSITLTGSLATEAPSTGGLFQGPSAIWSLLSGITAPLFHGGALRAQKRAAVDAYQATFADYRETVLSAFQQVADVLNALDTDNQLVDAEHRALAASSASLDLQRISYDAGKSNLLELVDAERSYQQARLGDARAVAQRYQDVTQLAVAMGGGWWQAPDTERQEWGTGH
ncbi:MAG TPA: efflux transporter outer membrane subunit [Nonomuraea sp.]|nr:efflux transporter outer membrane subunit [Nonomuraea sp.]